MADYIQLRSMDLTIADVIAQVEAELAPEVGLGDTVVYTFLEGGTIMDRPAIVIGALANGSLELVVVGATPLAGATVAERHNVRYSSSGEPNTWRQRGGQFR